jgi:hypothetical protein
MGGTEFVSSSLASLQEGLKLCYDWYCNENPQLADSKMNKIDYVLQLSKQFQ